MSKMAKVMANMDKWTEDDTPKLSHGHQIQRPIVAGGRSLSIDGRPGVTSKYNKDMVKHKQHGFAISAIKAKRQQIKNNRGQKGKKKIA